MKVGDEVQVVRDIYEGPDDHSPGGYYARKGEKLIVKSLQPDATTFKIYVAHPSRTDGNSFGVRADEITKG